MIFRSWLLRGFAPISLVGLVGNGAVGCDKPAGPAAPDATTTSAASGMADSMHGVATITLLVTSDENGYLLPQDAAKKGGAAQILGIWKTEDHHSIGKDSSTLALSTGDHWGGSSISSFFGGEPMADVMNKMAYAGSGFGNHELDFSREQFRKNQGKGGFPYISANVNATDDESRALKLEPFHVFERQGFKIGVVGLSDINTPKNAMPGRYDFMEFTPYEDTLAKSVPSVWAQGVDAVVVIADECPTALAPILEKHADWNIAALVGGHCSAPLDQKAGKTPLLSPAKHFTGFARVKLTFDGSKPAKEKLTGTTAQLVDVTASTVPPDADLTKTVDGYAKKTEAALGEEIGVTTTGLKAGSPEMTHWVGGALRENLKVDVALINKKGIRQDLPPGKITKGSVYSVMPFENAVLLLKLKGFDLLAALANPSVIADGPKGKIDPAKTYDVATVDYLYFGGDGLHLEKADGNPGETGRVWQTPVIEWTKKQATDDKKPLEKSLAK